MTPITPDAKPAHEHACAAVQMHRRAERHTPHRAGPRSYPGGPSPHQRWVKLTAMFSFDWSIAVKAEPFTWAVLFWFEAPEPVATC